MFYFNIKIFYFACYVAFTYACLAFGASYYRQMVDDMQSREYEFGEQLVDVRNPLAYFAALIFSLLFVAFSVFALTHNDPPMILYVIPLALGINVAQSLIRGHHQRTEFFTGGCVLKYLLRDSCIGFRYDELVRVRVEPTASWCRMSFYVGDNEYIGFTHISVRLVPRVLALIRSRSDCAIEEETQSPGETQN